MFFFSSILACLILATSAQGPGQQLSLQPQFSLTVWPTTPVIRQYTKDVKLRCAQVTNGHSTFSEFFTIRIVKQSSDGSWQNVADITGSSSFSHIEDPTVLAIGNISKDANECYIEITWAVADKGTIGVYRCEIGGMDKDLELISEHTVTVEIKEKKLTASDVFELLLQEKRNTMQSLLKLSQMITSTSTSTNTTTVAAVDESENIKAELDVLSQENQQTNKSVYELGKKLSEISRNVVRNTEKLDEITDQLSVLSRDNETTIDALQKLTGDVKSKCADANSSESTIQKRLDEVDEKLNHLDVVVQHVSNINVFGWPKGYYALLKTNTGCPKGAAFVAADKGRHVIQAESSDPDSPLTKLSDPIHLSKPITQSVDGENVLNLRYCLASGWVGEKWPSGSYCVSKHYNQSCPEGLDNGSILLDSEAEGFKQGSFLGPPDDMTFYFCCTHNSSAEDKIHLPTISPFYLYRFGGRCQQVEGLSVSEEFIEIATTNKTNEGKYENGNHPDGSIDSKTGRIRMELCYYTYPDE